MAQLRFTPRTLTQKLAENFAIFDQPTLAHCTMHILGVLNSSSESRDSINNLDLIHEFLTDYDVMETI